MENLDLSTILTLVISALGLFAGSWVLIAKKKIRKFVSLAKETYELIEKVETVLEDNKVTKEETEQVKKEAVDVKVAWKALVAKEQ